MFCTTLPWATLEEEIQRNFVTKVVSQTISIQDCDLRHCRIDTLGMITRLEIIEQSALSVILSMLMRDHIIEVVEK